MTSETPPGAGSPPIELIREVLESVLRLPIEPEEKEGVNEALAHLYAPDPPPRPHLPRADQYVLDDVPPAFERALAMAHSADERRRLNAAAHLYRASLSTFPQTVRIEGESAQDHGHGRAMPTDITTVPEPAHIADIGDALEALLGQDLTTPQRLAVNAAISRLYDVVPPYQPRPRQERETKAMIDVEAILRLMQAGVDATRSAQENIRIGAAAQLIRTAFT